MNAKEIQEVLYPYWAKISDSSYDPFTDCVIGEKGYSLMNEKGVFYPITGKHISQSEQKPL